MLLGLLWAGVLGGCKRDSGKLPASVVEGMNRGVSLMGQYQYEPAVQAFEQVLAVEPGLQSARVNLAIAVFNRNRKEDIDRSLQLLEQVLSKEPENTRALYFKAIVLQHIGKTDQAVPCLQRVLSQLPNDGAAWYLLGICHSRLGQPAEKDFLRAIQLRPYLYSAYYQLYQIQMRGDKPEEARKYLDQFQALRQSPLGESLEFPQYNQMGDLALAQPLPPAVRTAVSSSRYSLSDPWLLFSWPSQPSTTNSLPAGLAGIAVTDLNRDGRLDLVFALPSSGKVVVLKQTPETGFVTATPPAIDSLEGACSCVVGDFDNDGIPDLFVSCASGGRLLKGKGDCTFEDVTTAVGLSSTVSARSAVFVDADHDGDLDLFVCNRGSNQLWNNNGGSFTNIAAGKPVECAGSSSVLALVGDIDKDRDTDVIVLNEAGGAKAFLNQLFGVYEETDISSLKLAGNAGGTLQDFNGDGLLDLVVLGGNPAQLALFTGDGAGIFKQSEAFAAVAAAARSHGQLSGFRAADLDLDGDLDLVCFGAETQVLLNDGRGNFVLQTLAGASGPVPSTGGGECLDLTGDLVPDLLAFELGATNRLVLRQGKLSPTSSAVAIQPTGIRSRDERTRSPASGYGVALTVRAGMQEQHYFYTGQGGGANQSRTPVVAGLAGAIKADYVSLIWPDGVAQVEMGLAAGQLHEIAELQRKISSCPVLFTWDGSRFAFVTDFAGVGGLGYLASPGSYAAPQAEEHIKIDGARLRPRGGVFELRVTEPMEESAYVDALELRAIDHPAGTAVFPDERLAVSGPAPNHELLVVQSTLFPVRASGPSGQDSRQGTDCPTDSLTRVDRVYAYSPPLDRRYFGFCKPHTLELDFGNDLESVIAGARVFLFVNASIEYPYSQTVYAANQSRIGWEPIRVDAQESDGNWQTLVADAGAPGGIGRTIAIDLSGKMTPHTRKLRLTTNLEIYYDQAFLGWVTDKNNASVHSVPLRTAILRRVGFAREYSPDGHLPLIYNYEESDATAPFSVLKGAYTRYGDVRELLTRLDDCYVIMGPGDEIALRFDSAALPPTPAGWSRDFILVSHAYCKDMDLYTGTPTTLEPLPFRAMSHYPYSAPEQFPQNARAALKNYNTRVQD